MKEYFGYFWYVVKHKYFVFRACVKYGIIWRGLVHDLSKFLPSEFFPYARMFYGNRKPIRDKTGYYKPYDTGDDEFEYAWLKHTRRNKHHWQYWVLSHDEDDKSVRHQKVFDIPDKYIMEMICDWIGASFAQKTGYTAYDWYKVHRHKLGLSIRTRILIEKKLREIFE